MTFSLAGADEALARMQALCAGAAAEAPSAP